MKEIIKADAEAVEVVTRQSKARRSSDEDAAERSFLGFTLNEREYGIDLDFIVQIVKPPAVTWVPRSEPHILGVVSIRGAVVTLVDLKQLMDLEPSPMPRGARVLLVEIGQERVGLLVDGVTKVRRIDDVDLEKKPVLGKGPRGDYVLFLARPEPDKVIVMIDLNAVIRERLL